MQDQRLRAAKKKQTRRNLTPVAQIQPKARQLRYENPRSARAEEGILRLLMLDGSLVKQTQGLEPGQFSAPVLGKIYQVLLEHLKQGRPLQLGTLEGELEGGGDCPPGGHSGPAHGPGKRRQGHGGLPGRLETERMKQQTTTDEAVLLAARKPIGKRKVYRRWST